MPGFEPPSHERPEPIVLGRMVIGEGAGRGGARPSRRDGPGRGDGGRAAHGSGGGGRGNGGGGGNVPDPRAGGQRRWRGRRPRQQRAAPRRWPSGQPHGTFDRAQTLTEARRRVTLRHA